MVVRRRMPPLVLVAALTLLLGWLFSKPASVVPSLQSKPQFSIDVNAATERELESLPSIGPSAAKAIVRSRAEYGPFRDSADLDRVPGIGPATIEQLGNLIRAGDVAGEQRPQVQKDAAAGQQNTPVARDRAPVLE
ncbi:MAG: hypothetical protein Aurels2KO_04120 [Aureliella sp.]